MRADDAAAVRILDLTGATNDNFAAPAFYIDQVNVIAVMVLE